MGHSVDAMSLFIEDIEGIHLKTMKEFIEDIEGIHRRYWRNSFEDNERIPERHMTRNFTVRNPILPTLTKREKVSKTSN